MTAAITFIIAGTPALAWRLPLYCSQLWAARNLLGVGAAAFSLEGTNEHNTGNDSHQVWPEYLKVRPPDLTRIAIRNRGMFSRDRIEPVISGAETLPRGHGTKDMPVWGPVFSQIDWDRDFGPVRVANLAGYIEEMQKK
jgi:hypothetical protein